MSGGACFTPRLATRPAYPTASSVLKSTAVSYVRTSALAAGFTYAVHPIFLVIADSALNKAGWSEQMLFTVLTLLVHSVLYVGINGFFLLCELCGWFERYKFARKPYQVPDRKLMLRTWFEAAIGQLVTGPLVIYYMYHAFKYFGMPSLLAPLPNVQTLMQYYALAIFVNDFGFYWSHRLVHSKALYALIHKQHHTYTGSIGFAAEYANPIEQIVSNQLPTVGACLFFGFHPVVFLVWLATRLEQTYEAHSGYCFKGSLLHSMGLTNSEACAYHDYHHSGNRGNFGALWLDWLCGTMDAWAQLGYTDGYIAQCNTIAEKAAEKERKKVK